jgi:hypothetical protein
MSGKDWIVLNLAKQIIGRVPGCSYWAAAVIGQAYFPGERLLLVGPDALDTRRKRQAAHDAVRITAARCMERGLVLPAEVWAELQPVERVAAEGGGK